MFDSCSLQTFPQLVAVMFPSEQEGKCAWDMMEYPDILEESLRGTGMKIVEEGGCDEVDPLYIQLGCHTWSIWDF